MGKNEIGLVLVVAGALLLGACSDSDGSADGSGAGDATADSGDAGVSDAPAADVPVVDAVADVAVDAGGDAAADAAADAPAADIWPDVAVVGDLTPLGDGFNPTNHPACNGKIYACSDGVDNDKDGLADAQDPECTGPCDATEDSFLIGIPGVNSAICQQDCYWDDDSGSGNDDCEWTLKCDEKSPGAQFSPPCPYDEKYVNADKCPGPQTQDCLDFCLPVTPNGCDCFGCCEIWTTSGKYAETVYLGSGPTCTATTPENCAPCTQVADCLNGCGDCELCLGKTIADLPPKCWGTTTPDGGVPDGSVPDAAPTDGPPPDMGIVILPIECPDGQDPCIDNSYCQDGYYCITGCCVKGID